MVFAGQEPQLDRYATNYTLIIWTSVVPFSFNMLDKVGIEEDVVETSTCIANTQLSMKSLTANTSKM